MTSVLVHSTETHKPNGHNGFNAKTIAELMKGLTRTKAREKIAKAIAALKPGTEFLPAKIAKETGLHSKQVTRTLHDFAVAGKLDRHKDERSGNWLFTTTAGPVEVRPIVKPSTPGPTELLRKFLDGLQPGATFTVKDLEAITPDRDSNAWSATLAYFRAHHRIILIGSESVPSGGKRNVYAKPHPEDYIAPTIPTQRTEPETEPEPETVPEETETVPRDADEPTPQAPEEDEPTPAIDSVNVFPANFIPASGDWFEMMRFPAGIQVETETNRRGETVLWVRRTK